MLALIDWVRTCTVVGIEMTAGDVFCQNLEHKQLVSQRDELQNKANNVQVYDYARTAAMALTGAAITGPLVHLMVASNERIYPGNSVRAVIVKASINLIWSPLLIAATLSGSMWLRGKSNTEIKQKIDVDFLPTCVTGLGFWPPVNIVQYAFVPLKWRASAGACAGGIWSTYLSYQSTKAHEDHAVHADLNVPLGMDVSVHNHDRAYQSGVDTQNALLSVQRQSSADKIASAIHASPLHRRLTGQNISHVLSGDSEYNPADDDR
ncbi:hypothetical protein SARC_04997 [Sphaeroforma arctica JP610]|uniref:Uncharacterized protein n=1 Tax=Sphaeroforma arctica JP610 TaxID=667725 RepID=A0A0L0G1N2_9EUKA|nr:hypothetical protein SARC_04997 [Sphaeroforma arctica JP610]KNC82726.1 hypothetical protein SARC_04997 [Sphaeroforma arctica JP610]|eukprot:XP_014156628.1 hypothetical protein SARC_04997 [Sphaeroforma arctica JP610]